MPEYTCSTAACSTGGQPFNLTSANQTFCPNCFNNTLQPFVRARQVFERMVNLPADPAKKITTATGAPLTECGELINKFHLTRQSEDEAKKTSDYIVRLGSDKRKRIDRQGPVKTGNTVTHARFAVQLGDPIYAGIHMPIDVDFTIGHVRAALRQSLTNHVYVRIFKEEV